MFHAPLFLQLCSLFQNSKFLAKLIVFHVLFSASISAMADRMWTQKNSSVMGGVTPRSGIKSVVLVGHGLNNPPRVMFEIGESLAAQGHEVIYLEFKGHDESKPDREIRIVSKEDWLKNMGEALAFASARAKANKVPLNYLAFSLGCLVFETYQNLNPDKFKVAKRVYLAPALGINGYSYLVKYIPFGKSWIMPTQNRKDVIANSGSSIQAYQELFRLLDDLKALKMKASKIPTKLILSKGDELISVKKTNELIKRYGLGGQWTVETVSKSKEARDYSFNHFFLTKLALGEDEFNSMMSSVQNFLDVKISH